MRYALLLAIALAGCGRTWQQPGVTPLDANRAEYECLQDATAQAQGGGPARDPFLIGGLRDACMRARGFEVRVVTP